MNRRSFSLQVASAAALATLAGELAWPRQAAAAESAPVVGQDYQRLAQPAPIESAGKIEVLEFFWYACPHCWHFEPVLEPWAHRLPADVRFMRVPVAFGEFRKEFHQRLYYTLEALDLVDTLHAKVFQRFHVQHRPIDREADLVDFARENGLDAEKFKQTFNGFTVQTRIARANAQTEAYGVDGTPEVGVQGRFLTAPSMAGDETRALAVTDYLINLSRKAS
jgi:thiol:disulfide interchange protein DsbA